MPVTSQNKREVLERLRQRHGDGAIPQVDPDSLPDEFWERAGTHLDEKPDDEPMWKRILGAAYSTPITPAQTGVDLSVEDIWNRVRPGLERAEEAGQLIGSPIIQSVIDPKYDVQEGYQREWKAFLDNLRSDDGGVDVRGATKAGTTAADVSPYVAGTAGVVFDPLNLVPGRAFAAGPQAAARVAQATSKGVKAGAKQAGKEVVGAVKAYPAAMAEEGEQIAEAAKFLGRSAEAGAKLPAMALMGAGGGGPGRSVPPINVRRGLIHSRDTSRRERRFEV